MKIAHENQNLQIGNPSGTSGPSRGRAGTIVQVLETAIAAYQQPSSSDAERPFGEELRALRERLELTQKAFADRYDIPVDNIRNWEQASRGTRPDAAARLLLKMIKAEPERVAEIVRRVQLNRTDATATD